MHPLLVPTKLAWPDILASGAAREPFEETGLDLRHDLDRLEHVNIRGQRDLKGRQYYKLMLRPGDSVPSGEMPYTGEQFKLKLSDEHQGFCFEPDGNKAAEMIKAHSGGKNREALLEIVAQAPAAQTTRLSMHSRTSRASVSDYF